MTITGTSYHIAHSDTWIGTQVPLGYQWFGSIEKLLCFCDHSVREY